MLKDLRAELQLIVSREIRKVDVLEKIGGDSFDRMFGRRERGVMFVFAR